MGHDSWPLAVVPLVDAHQWRDACGASNKRNGRMIRDRAAPSLRKRMTNHEQNLSKPFGATNPLRGQGKRGFDTEGGQTDLRCVESGYAYNNNRLLAAEASPARALGRQ